VVDAAMEEYADFLGGQPPYDSLTSDELRRLVEELEVEYVAAGTMIVQAASHGPSRSR